VVVTVLDSVWAAVDKAYIRFLSPCLTYEVGKKRPKMDGSGGTHIVKVQMYVDGVKQGRFPLGLLSRVVTFCKRRGEEVEVRDESKIPSPKAGKPKLYGVALRKDQESFVATARKEKRGVFKAPTGSGKTVVAAAIISCYPKTTNVLFLCHTLTLLEQTKKEFKTLLSEEIGTVLMQEEIGSIGDSIIDIQRITVSTMQSFDMLLTKDEKMKSMFSIMIVDECHHITKFDGTYARIFTSTNAPIRIGFTATLYKERSEQALCLESFIGPVIEELTMDEGIEEKIIARPKVKIYRTPDNPYVKALHNYVDVYEQGIVYSRARNRLIVSVAKEKVEQGYTVLIIIRRLDHGDEIIRTADLMGFHGIVFVQGATKTLEREKIRNELNKKDVKCVVASAVWREGVNIPSLDVIINAAGGKSEITTLQALGRGLRRTKDKEEVLLIDIFDPSNYILAMHFCERFCMYCDQNWV
jgi:superfamily II DNA or RNA helicase